MIDLGNVKEIFTKIILRNDVLKTWEASDIILEKGEPALALDLEKKVAKFKIGDGSHTFNELPYSTVTPDEVQEMIDASMVEGGAVNSVSLESGTKDGTLRLVVNNVMYDNIAVTGLGSAAFTEASDYATAEQGRRAAVAMHLKGTIGSVEATVVALPMQNINEGDAYKAIASFIISSDDSYTGTDESVSSGDVVVAMYNKKWMVIPSGSAEVAKSLAEGISAVVTGGVTGSAVAANAGETLNIEVTSINMDYITSGTKTIILNGGSATQ